MLDLYKYITQNKVHKSQYLHNLLVIIYEENNSLNCHREAVIFGFWKRGAQFEGDSRGYITDDGSAILMSSIRWMYDF